MKKQMWKKLERRRVENSVFFKVFEKENSDIFCWVVMKGRDVGNVSFFLFLF